MKQHSIEWWVQFIRFHYIPAVYSPQRNCIRAVERYTTRDDRAAVNCIVDLPLDGKAIDSWLGY